MNKILIFFHLYLFIWPNYGTLGSSSKNKLIVPGNV